MSDGPVTTKIDDENTDGSQQTEGPAIWDGQVNYLQYLSEMIAADLDRRIVEGEDVFCTMPTNNPESLGGGK